MHQRSALPLSLLAAAALGGLAAGCSDPPTTNPDAGLVIAGRSCNVDSECGGLRCDPVRRVCVCLSDDSCCADKTQTAAGGCAPIERDGVATPYCNNFTGLCMPTVAGCKVDADCPAGSRCDSEVRSCKPRKGLCDTCSSDEECGGEFDFCIRDDSLNTSFCGLNCSADYDCPQGAACIDKNGHQQCWPESGKNCRVFAGCTPDSRKACTTTNDCADVPDQLCTGGICTAREQVCPFGQVCDSRSRVCVDACNTDADCQAIDPRLRCVSSACEPIDDCGTSVDDPTGDLGCPLNKVCALDPAMNTGVCVPFCATSADCRHGELCLRTADGRSRCQAGCQVNADCPPDKTCDKPAGSFIGSCKGTSGLTCQTDLVCPSCNICDLSSYTCRLASALGYCRPCGVDADCGSSHCLDLHDPVSGVTDTRCGQPCPATGCPSGFFCADVCVGTFSNGACQGTTFGECIPVDQTCTFTAANGQVEEKCP